MTTTRRGAPGATPADFLFNAQQQEALRLAKEAAKSKALARNLQNEADKAEALTRAKAKAKAKVTATIAGNANTIAGIPLSVILIGLVAVGVLVKVIFFRK